MKIKKIGILTWHHYSNVGSNLQAIAMQNIFSTPKIEAQFINYRPHYFEPWYRNLIRLVCGTISDSFPHALPEMLRFRAYSFQRKYMNQSELIIAPEKLTDVVKRYDAIICGSDQIWAPNVYKKEYLLSFVPDEIDKYAYGASIGLNSIPSDLIDNYRMYLKRFALIGVREAQGAKIIRGIIPECSDRIYDVLEPTFLVPVSYWNGIAKKTISDENYLLCYFLGDNEWQREYVSGWAKEHGLKLIVYSAYDSDIRIADLHIKYTGPCEFIGLVQHASHIMTDSFHGMVFSIIYNKQFNVFYRFNEDDPICQNSRVDNLIDKFGIQQVVVKEKEKNNHTVNYDKVNPRVEKEVSRSKEFVSRILKQAGG